MATTLTQAKVSLVIDTIRHGARSPIHNFSFFENINWDYLGEITPVGERMHYLLGRLRREKYIEKEGLLPRIYDPTLLLARSTAVNRTLMSAQSYLLGLYPEGMRKLNDRQQKHTHDLLVPPISLSITPDVIDALGDNPVPYSVPVIPIHSVARFADTLLRTSSCPYVMEAMKRFFNSEKYYKLVKDYKEMWDKIVAAYPEITWEYLMRAHNAYGLADYIVCSIRNGRTPSRLPYEITFSLQKFLGAIQNEEYSFDPMINPLTLHEYTKTLIHYMKKTIHNTNKLKYILYSAHDETLIRILQGLRKFNSTISWDTVPDYASNLIFELNKDESSEPGEAAYSVNIIYNGNIIHSEKYQDFAPKLLQVGKLNTTREEGCKVTSLRGGVSSKPIEFLDDLTIIP